MTKARGAWRSGPGCTYFELPTTDLLRLADVVERTQSAIHGLVCKLLLDAEKLVVLRHTVGAGRSARQ